MRIDLLFFQIVSPLCARHPENPGACWPPRARRNHLERPGATSTLQPAASGSQILAPVRTRRATASRPLVEMPVEQGLQLLAHISPRLQPPSAAQSGIFRKQRHPTCRQMCRLRRDCKPSYRPRLAAFPFRMASTQSSPTWAQRIPEGTHCTLVAPLCLQNDLDDNPHKCLPWICAPWRIVDRMLTLSSCFHDPQGTDRTGSFG